eukprot:6491365-Amphidinium_carterae.1
MSIGRRVEEEGYEFHWTPGCAELVTPSGARVKFDVRNFVPMLSDECGECNVINQDALPADECEDGTNDGADAEALAEHEVPGADAHSAREKYIRRGLNKDWAESREHSILHYPKNPYCPCCREVRAIACPARRIRRGAESVRTEQFGDLIHMDHIIMNTASVGREGETCCLVLLDDFTGFVGTYPAKERSAVEVVAALRHFVGRQRGWQDIAIKADNTKEYSAVCKELGVAYHRSTPYRHQSNSKIERMNRSMIEGTRAVLQQSGLPHAAWTEAIRFYAIAWNVGLPNNTGGVTAWHARFGDEFVGKIVPFGAVCGAVVHGPVEDKRQKFGAAAQDVVFCGWEMCPGFTHWDYRVALCGVVAHSENPSAWHVHRTRELLTRGELAFAMEGATKYGGMLLRHVAWEEADDPTLKMMSEGVVDEAGGLSEDMIAKGWRLDRFGDTLVRVPPRSTRPAGIDPASWRGLPYSVRKAVGVKSAGASASDAARGSTQGVELPNATASDAALPAGERVVAFGADAGARSARVCCLEDLQLGLGMQRFHAHVKGSRGVIVEVCCESNSVIGARAYEGVAVIRVTVATDVRDEGVCDMICNILRFSNVPVMLWISSPCTTGCAWLNTLPQVTEKPEFIARHREDMKTAVSCQVLAQCACDQEQFFVWEWPKSCKHWKSELGEKVRGMPGTTDVLFDGCMFGIESKGIRLNKPWRLVTNSTQISDEFHGKVCDRQHEHGQCRGGAAVASGKYNENIAASVHQAFMKECRKLGGRLKECSRVTGLSERGGAQPAVVAVGNAVLNAMGSSETMFDSRNWDSCVREFHEAMKGVRLSLSVQRTNVYEHGCNLRGELLGCYTCRGAGVTSSCDKPEWVRVVMAVHALAQFRGGDRQRAPYLAIQINKIEDGRGMREHVDRNNGGWSDVIALGEFSGGEFVTEQGEFDCRERWVAFDGRRSHHVKPHVGERYSIVLFSPENVGRLKNEDWSKLAELGFDVDGALNVVHDDSSYTCQLESGVDEWNVPVEPQGEHRSRESDTSVPVDMAMIVRQIFPKDAEWHTEACQHALRDELKKLRSKNTWNEDKVREYKDVLHDPTQKDAMFGRVFAILGQKNSEAISGEKPYKARAVFEGNRIHTKSGVAPHELFQQLANTPSSMAAARLVMGLGASRNHKLTLRDVSQAYLQAFLEAPGRVSTWASLPRSWWPSSWFDQAGKPRFEQPVVLLEKALYGHPEAGALWEQALAAHLTKRGWKKVDAVAGVWTRPIPGARDCSTMVVYVDDLLVSAPESETDKIWRELEQDVEFKDPPAEVSRYLGANHTVHEGTNMTRMQVEMAGYTAAAVRKFENDLGGTLKAAPTPFDPQWGEEDAEVKGEGDEDPEVKGEDDEDPEVDRETPGRFSSVAASHVATLLFLTRMARPDLATSVVRLSRYVTKWKKEHDRALTRLFSYLKGTSEMVMGFEMDHTQDIALKLWCDSDLAGDRTDCKSTSGFWLELVCVSTGSSWPIAWGSKRQMATAHSTCEAEALSLAAGMREEAIPALDLAEQILGRSIDLMVCEDNTQVVSAVKRGYSKKLRHLPRVHRVSVGALHDMFHGDLKLASLQYVRSEDNKSDLFTKQFERIKFEALRASVGVCKSEPAVHAGEGGVKGNSTENTPEASVAAPCMNEDSFACWCLERDCSCCRHKYLPATVVGSSFPNCVSCRS